MSDAARIVVLPGDGIGPEIVGATRTLLEALGEFEYDERLVGGISIDEHGVALTDEVLDACKGADAVLLGAVGGPKWDTTDPDAPRPEQGLLPLREERIAGTDLLVVRELTGGIYFGDSGRDGDVAHDTCEYSVEEIDRIARTAFDAARRRAESSGRRSPRSTRPTCWRPPVSGARWSATSPPTTPTSSSNTSLSTTPRCSSSRGRPTSMSSSPRTSS